jgi:hypothetical protein
VSCYHRGRSVAAAASLDDNNVGGGVDDDGGIGGTEDKENTHFGVVNVSVNTDDDGATVGEAYVFESPRSANVNAKRRIANADNGDGNNDGNGNRNGNGNNGDGDGNVNVLLRRSAVKRRHRAFAARPPRWTPIKSKATKAATIKTMKTSTKPSTKTKMSSSKSLARTPLRPLVAAARTGMRSPLGRATSARSANSGGGGGGTHEVYVDAPGQVSVGWAL